MLEGIVVVNKPSGITSHDVVSRVRRKFQMKRVGHAGTLDPMATGVLIALVGKATKKFDQFVAYDKGYRATMVLGLKTTSADTQGETISEKKYNHVTEEDVLKAFEGFRGKIEQIPPMVSAVKHKGKKLYELARKGITVERKPRSIEIYKLEMVSFKPPHVEIYVECSKGTYIRQLAEDIGERLTCGACISQIERTHVGQYALDQAVTLEELDESCLRNI